MSYFKEIDVIFCKFSLHIPPKLRCCLFSRLTQGLTRAPVVFRIAVWISGAAELFARRLPDVGVEPPLPLFENDDPCAIGQMVVLRVSARKTAVGKQHVVPHDRVIVVVIMAYEDAHHVAAFFHGCEHAGVEFGRTGCFHARADHDVVFRGRCLIVFGQRDVEEGQRGHGRAAVFGRELAALPAIPVYLFEREPRVAVYAFQLRHGVRVHAIEQGGGGVSRRWFHLQHVVGRAAAVAVGLNVVRCAAYLVVECFVGGGSLCGIVVAEEHDEWHVLRRQAFENVAHGLAARVGVYHVARYYDEIGVLGPYHCFDAA